PRRVSASSTRRRCASSTATPLEPLLTLGTSMTKPSNGADPQPDGVSEEAARNTLALNPLVGVRGQDLMDSAAIMLKAMVNEPVVAASQWLLFMGELIKITTGQSERAPAAGDKRFADATWKSSALHRGLLQAYLAWAEAVNGFIDKT